MTIKDLATELGVSKEAIRKHLSKIPDSELKTGQRGAVILSPVAADLIRQLITTNTNEETDNQQPTGNRAKTHEINNISGKATCLNCQLLNGELATANEKIQLLTDNLKDIRGELERKNIELDAKNQQISELMQALQNEQILHGKMMQLEAPKQRKWYDAFRKNKDAE